MSTKVLHQYHDAVLMGISTYNASDSYLLSFKHFDGKKSELILSGCELVRMVDYTTQNIVSRLVVYQGATVDRVDVATKLTWGSELLDASSYLTQETINRIIERISSGSACLIYLEPSSGAEVVALCNGILERSAT
ncbi:MULTISPECIES: hypothetical protein [Pseudomonas]|uniref:hypothetical protein n=1 Tax=Pseudomonas TaxID=286 RepID=UPI0011609C83|nr:MULTISPECIES: hypothetical protein [Pseudomonas]NHN68222.1 hypothetical protein [Pseudomonas fluorescens]